MSSNFISFNEFQNQTQTQGNIQQDPSLSQKIKTNTLKIDTQNSLVSNPLSVDTLDLENKIKNAKRKNGLIEKLADKTKSLIGIGHNSKKLDETLENVKQGKISEQEAQKEIKLYRSSQENVAQAVGDVASSTAAIGAFFGIKQGAEKLVAQYITINNSKDTIVSILQKSSEKLNDKKKFKKVVDFAKNFVEKHVDKRYSAVIAGVAGAVLIGGIVKTLILSLNRIGTKQYKADIDKETMSKKEIKQAKKQAKKEKKAANRRNFFSGAINGLMTPILSVLGVVGAPIYLLGNSLSRYFIGTTEDKKNKSFNGYVENIKSSPITHALSAIAIAIPAIKHGKANKIFEKNFDEVVKNLKEAKLDKQATQGKTSYQQLEEVLFNNERISSIINDKSLELSERIQLLSDENIFAVKFKQIDSNADKLAQALKSSCPATRTLDEAQELISQTFGDKYQIQKCVGVGTVAETYLVKDGDREFCIKMLKNGISADKINADKQKFIDIINSLEGKTPQEKQFLIDNVENIAQGVLAEVDFNNEMNAAQELAKVTKKAKLVKPITVKNGLYVMEKADGISLDDFGTYQNLKWRYTDYDGKLIDKSEFIAKVKQAQEELQDYQNNNFATEYEIQWKKERLEECQKQLREYSRFAELHEMGIDKLSEQETQKMLEAYQDILIEQFSEVNKNGKIIHGDIHPGNIFIDVNALKAGKSDFFTLIDTGNTIQQSQASAMRFLNLSHYIKNADYENIADFVLEGATLPDGLDKAQAREKLVEELKTAFFDNETNIGKVTNDSILSITDGIMQKLNIIPSDTQGNLMKTKTSANQSMIEFAKMYYEALGRDFDKKYQNTENMNANMMGDLVGMGAKVAKTNARYRQATKQQEKLNLAMLSPADKAKFKKSASAPDKNSKEYLTYLLKQSKKLSDAPQENTFISLDELS